MDVKNSVYRFEILSHYTSIFHGISTTVFGSMKDVKKKEIDRTVLTKFAQSIGITDPIVCMWQVHSGNVSTVHNNKKLRITETDALVTNKKHLPLAVLTADCLPILFYDPKKESIGVAHAGYRGLLNNIIGHTINRLVAEFKSDVNDIIVGIGPGIERDCYEVGEELLEEFQEKFPSFDDIFSEKDQKYFLDLRSVAKQSLLTEGILSDHIEIMDVCTKDDNHFYSYRGGDGDKRFVSVISLV